MKRRESLRRALAYTAAVAAISALAGASVGIARAEPVHWAASIVINGSGKRLNVKQSGSSRAVAPQDKADKMNADYNAGFDLGFSAGQKAGFHSGFGAGQAKVTGAAVTAAPALDPSTYGGSARFQTGYKSGYNVGFTRAYNTGVSRGYQAEVASEAAAAAAANQAAADAAAAQNAAALDAANTNPIADGSNGFGYRQIGRFTLIRPVIVNGPPPPVLNPLFGMMRF